VRPPSALESFWSRGDSTEGGRADSVTGRA
jgi:hypothetical protein